MTHAAEPGGEIAERFRTVRPLADDAHFAVREWAWLALRECVRSEVSTSLTLLMDWTLEPSPFLRRFAIEITRPRGVWARKIDELLDNPDLGLPLLDNVRADPEKYVQDSAANWLNDIARTNPAWVRQTCSRWLQRPSPQTERICRRAQRSIPDAVTAE